jgi:hypothetical protein
MSVFKTKSVADHVDNHRRLLFLAMFLISLIFAVKTAFYLVDQDVESYLGIVAKGIFGLLMLIVLVLIYWKIRYLPRGRSFLLISSESYAQQALHRACVNSWVFTLMLLTLIMSTTSHDSAAFPTEFYLNLIVFFMLVVFSVSFFILFRGGGEEDFDEERG